MTRQRMNAVFGPWRLVNSYGAFGTVTKRRFEVELQGTRDAYPTDDAAWLAYEFAAKPGDPQRTPRWLAPYHLRNDSPPSPNARCPPTLEPCSVACDLPRLPPDLPHRFCFPLLPPDLAPRFCLPDFAARFCPWILGRQIAGMMRDY